MSNNIRVSSCILALTICIALPSTSRADNPATTLVSRPWRFLGSWWFAVRTFSQDGTFTTVGNESEHGKWSITQASVVLTFPDGHRDTMTLPLSLQGTTGQDKDGKTVIITPGKEPETDNTSSVHSTSSLSFLKATPTPSAVDIARRNVAAATTLSSAPWKFTGRAWTAIRIFASNGTFTTADHANETGKWKIEGNKVSLIYKDGHIDTLSLPLDPKLGTDAADQHGAPVLAIQIDPSSVPTPAPAETTTAQSGVDADPTPAAARTPRPAQGPTPPPFGVAIPPQ